MEESPNQGSAPLTEEVSDQAASETVKENVKTETAADNIPSYEWHRRVLGENKKYKSQLNEAQEQLKTYEQKEMEAKGQHQDLINALRQENQKLKAGIDERDQVYQWSKRSEALRSALRSNGCVKPDHLLRLMDEEVLNQIQVDDQYNPVQEDVNRVVEAFRGDSDYAYLFRGQTHSVNTVNPQAKIEKDAPRALKDIPLHERIAMLELGKSKE